MLRYLEEYHVSEIAGQLGIMVPTAKELLRRARGKLRAVLAQRWKDA